MPKQPSCTCGTCRSCKHRVYMREYFRRNRDKNAEKHRKWYANPENAARVKQQARDHRAATDPAKKRAQDAVMRALRRGELVRPDRCARCNANVKPVAHHHDYSKPLAVEWLCRSCHAREHSPYK